jgi:hypothetical protein
MMQGPDKNTVSLQLPVWIRAEIQVRAGGGFNGTDIFDF